MTGWPFRMPFRASRREDDIVVRCSEPLAKAVLLGIFYARDAVDEPVSGTKPGVAYPNDPFAQVRFEMGHGDALTESRAADLDKAAEVFVTLLQGTTAELDRASADAVCRAANQARLILHDGGDMPAEMHQFVYQGLTLVVDRLVDATT